MHITLLDLLTHERRDCPDYPDMDVRYWSEGDGGCDCNRAVAFGGDEAYEDQRARLRLAEDDCLGYNRWLIVAVHGDLEGYTTAEVLALVNQDYPERDLARPS